MSDIFELVREQVPILEIAQHLLKSGKKLDIFFYPNEKEPSIKIYPESDSFFDFGRCVGGDCIRLWSHICQVSDMEAAKAISAEFGLGLNASDKITVGEVKRRQRAKLDAEQARKQAWKRWRNKVDYLKSREKLYTDLLASPHVMPMSELWVWCKNDLQIIRYRLDVLCGID